MNAIEGSRGHWVFFAVTLLLGVPGAWLHLSGAELPALLALVIFGTGILAGAFLLSWAAEVAELDISASLAIAILALMTILPEYAIETVLAWDAGATFDTATREVTAETRRVAANVTGANRLLIGVGWSVVILIYWFKHRDRMDLRGHLDYDFRILALATLITFSFFFLGGVSIWLAGVLIALYLAYLWLSSTEQWEQPEFMGVTAELVRLPVKWRRTAVVCLFLYAAAVVVLAAEPFVESLIGSGRGLGIDDFILIQWIAPLASETPEILVAAMFAMRASGGTGLTVLIASEVNKFTLLTGSMVALFSASAGELLTFPLDDRQGAEFLLTAAFSLLGLLLISKRLLDWRTGALLLGLFVAHLFFPSGDDRMWIAVGYVALSVILVALDRQRLVMLVRE